MKLTKNTKTLITVLAILAALAVLVGVMALAVAEHRLASAENKALIAAGQLDAKAHRKYRLGALALIFPLLYCLFDTVGTAADGIIALQHKLGWINEDKMPVYRAKWEAICAVLADSPTPEEILGMLTDVGLSMDDFYDMYSEEKLADAIRCAKDLKDRYTVLWLHEQVK